MKTFMKQHISEEFSPSVAIIRFRNFFFVQIHSSSLSPVPQSQSALQKNVKFSRSNKKPCLGPQKPPIFQEYRSQLPHSRSFCMVILWLN